MGGGVQNKMALCSSGNLALRWGIVNEITGKVIIFCAEHKSIKFGLPSMFLEFSFLCLLIYSICFLSFSVHITADKTFYFATC